MTTEINTKWDYEKLNTAMAFLEYHSDISGDSRLSECLKHAVEFNDYNMEQLEVLSPSEHYLTHE